VRRVVAPNPGPYTGPGTNTWILGDEPVLAVIDPGKCFGRGCEYCIAVCPVPDCITLTTDPQAPTLSVCTVNFDTCIGCMACEKWCPDDYDAIRMVPFATVMKDRDSYETATFSAISAQVTTGGLRCGMVSRIGIKRGRPVIEPVLPRDADVKALACSA